MHRRQTRVHTDEDMKSLQEVGGGSIGEAEGFASRKAVGFP
jgi:hypothetical protein